MHRFDAAWDAARAEWAVRPVVRHLRYPYDLSRPANDNCWAWARGRSLTGVGSPLTVRCRTVRN
jgi:hypothetical protein